MTDTKVSAAADTRISYLDADTPNPTFGRSLFYNDIGPEGAKAIGEALKTNQSLKELKYATSRPQLPPSRRNRHEKCQQPLTPRFTLVRSLRSNNLDAEAAKHLAEGLKENKALQTLEYAPS